MSVHGELSEDDLTQDIARSSYADMLLDDERNLAYDSAIRLCVKTLVDDSRRNHKGEKRIKCCDVGTGSGLLSMMIVRAFMSEGYDNFHIYALEAFKPMADCAVKVIDLNRMSANITVISGRAEDYVNGDVHLLVAELLDTELIGEGCLEVYHHAIQRICAPDCLFVPHKARVYIEPIWSKFLHSRHRIQDIALIGSESRSCMGLAEVDDLQLSAVKTSQHVESGDQQPTMTKLTEAQVMFEFTFNSVSKLRLTEEKLTHFKCKIPDDAELNSSSPLVVAMWWDIVMSDQDKVMGCSENPYQVISMAPTWARNDEMLERDMKIKSLYGREVWREHWIQAVYAFAICDIPDKCLTQDLFVAAYHDAFSFWFQCSSRADYVMPSLMNQRPTCTCGVHRKLSRPEMQYLNHALAHSELISLKLPAQVDFVHEIELELGKYEPNHKRSCQDEPVRIRSIIASDMESKIFIPAFCKTEVPWTPIVEYLSPAQLNLRFSIQYLQVSFTNLNRIRTEVSRCEGFDLSPLDSMISSASKRVDKRWEAHYLWQYETTSLDYAPRTLVKGPLRDFHQLHNQVETISTRFCQTASNGDVAKNWKRGWAVVFWMRIQDENDCVVYSNGPTLNEPIQKGQSISWVPFHKQIVYFLHDVDVDSSLANNAETRFKIDVDKDYTPLSIGFVAKDTSSLLLE